MLACLLHRALLLLLLVLAVSALCLHLLRSVLQLAVRVSKLLIQHADAGFQLPRSRGLIEEQESSSTGGQSNAA